MRPKLNLDIVTVRNFVFSICGMLMLFGASEAQAALEAWNAHVVAVEGTYMPTIITFQLDAPDPQGFCPSQTTWFKWNNANIDNNKAVYAGLLEALATGKEINFYINADSACTGQFIHFLNN